MAPEKPRYKIYLPVKSKLPNFKPLTAAMPSRSNDDTCKEIKYATFAYQGKSKSNVESAFFLQMVGTIANSFMPFCFTKINNHFVMQNTLRRKGRSNTDHPNTIAKPLNQGPCPQSIKDRTRSIKGGHVWTRIAENALFITCTNSHSTAQRHCEALS